MEPKILVIDCGSNKTKYISQIVDEYMDVTTCKLSNFTLEDLKEITGVIISGAPILITEVDPSTYIKKVEWIKNTKIPTLGICFGHQLIGLLFGASASRMREDRDWQTVEAYEDCILFNRLPKEIEMMEDHCETVSIPPNFQLIASSDTCINEVMQHETLPIYGVQFHPEVSGNHGNVLIENFVKTCTSID